MSVGKYVYRNMPFGGEKCDSTSWQLVPFLLNLRQILIPDTAFWSATATLVLIVLIIENSARIYDANIFLPVMHTSIGRKCFFGVDCDKDVPWMRISTLIGI